MIGEALKIGASLYFRDFGWTCIPLIPDAQGLPKRPFTEGWQHITHDAERVGALPWHQAKGLGIVLGSASANLAVLDIDDAELGALCIELCQETRRIHTIRNRAHIYVTEEEPSGSSRSTIRWHDRDITIELKAQGTQVAAPPTPGYRHACPVDMPPLKVTSVADTWQQLALRLGLGDTTIASDYPQPWADTVNKGDRNMAAYVESHRLREAGIPLNQAIDLMRIRWENVYQHQGQGWYEIERTIKSAYRKGIMTTRGGDELAGLLD